MHLILKLDTQMLFETQLAKISMQHFENFVRDIKFSEKCT